MDIKRKDDVMLDLDKKVYQIFSDFMMRVMKFEELVSVGSSFLAGLHQHLELLRRRPIHKTSDVVEGVIKANGTKRLKAYLKSGCINLDEGVQSVSKLIECQKGLQEHMSKVRGLLSEVEGLMTAVQGVLTSACEYKFSFEGQHTAGGFVVRRAELEKEEMESIHPRRPSASDYAAIMCSIYNMLKQDFIMQEKIIVSTEICHPSSEELGSYTTMWTLRPYIKDEIISEAWKFVT
ncbi:hypothetical protein MKW94_022461 [Papaver nudicaule]|uniref:DUF7795 domain-containing protein n=1 Tax=Papaver nudicaule TaxID=74823 RepID=A0AA41SJW7_PAPNU|nr:hypothetical protein [Papaver nudicaule]